MRLIERNDVVLLSALAIALVVVLASPLSRSLEYAREVDQTRGVSLFPALIILLTVFIALQIWKRQERKAAEAIAAVERQQNAERIKEMHRLVAFGQALARSLDETSIRASAAAHLPLLAPGRAIWALVRKGSQWSSLAVVGDGPPGARERCASHAFGDIDMAPDANDDVCFPMIVGGTPVGVLGASCDPPLTDHQRGVLAAAAALLAVSVKNAELFGAAHENSVRDSLTGCFNRKYTLEVLEVELRRARRSKMPVAVLMFDIDHFKTINDTYGHLCGDAVLASIGARMKNVLRGSDLKCRYGGEEFLVVLPDTPLAGARRVAETLRREIAEHGVAWNGGTVRVTASFGLTTIVTGEVDTMPVLERADRALYAAKDAGRNRICTEERRDLSLSVEQPSTAA
jgi:diguanylate cyclase (GGDEF)-like protein